MLEHALLGLNDALRRAGFEVIDWRASPGLDQQFNTDAGVTDDPRSLLDAVATRFKGAAAQLVGSPFFLYGSVADLRRQLLERRERLGTSYVGVPEKVFEAFAPLVRELRGA